MSTEPSSSGPSRSPDRLPMVALLCLAVVAACTNSAPPSPGTASPAVAASASASATNAAEGSSSPPPASASPVATSNGTAALALNGASRTITDDLRVRSAPGTADSSKKLEPLLSKGTRLYMIAGPVAADGYDWYQIVPFDHRLPQGWIASASRQGEQWVEDDAESCPTPPLDAAKVLSLMTYGGLACFGDREVEVVGEVHCEFADVDSPISGPDWIHHDRYCTLNLGGESRLGINDGGMTLGFPMTGQASVTGHFDDAQAVLCTSADDELAREPARIVLDCRAQFVGTSIDGVQ